MDEKESIMVYEVYNAHNALKFVSLRNALAAIDFHRRHALEPGPMFLRRVDGHPSECADYYGSPFN